MECYCEVNVDGNAPGMSKELVAVARHVARLWFWRHGRILRCSCLVFLGCPCSLLMLSWNDGGMTDMLYLDM